LIFIFLGRKKKKLKRKKRFTDSKLNHQQKKHDDTSNNMIKSYFWMSGGTAYVAQQVPASLSMPHADVIFSFLDKCKLLLIYLYNYKKNHGKKLKIPLILRLFC